MSKPIKVAYFLQRFPAITRTFIAREADWIREHDVDITIFSLLQPTDKVVHKQSKKLLPLVIQSPYLSIKIIRANVYFLRTVPVRYIQALCAVIWQTYHEPDTLLKAITLFPKSVYFARKVKDGNYDHIHTHFVYIGAIAADVASTLTGVSHSVRPHAFGLFERNQKSARKSLERANKIITISTYHKQYIAELCPDVDAEHIHAVYCGLETSQTSSKIAEQRTQTPQILSIGRAIEKKGHEYLAEACATLAERGVNFHCTMVVGDDAGSKKLQELVNKLGCENQITLLGDQSQAEIMWLYNRSDIFALACVVAKSGDRDGIPSVLIEAMACGLPVATTNVAGIPDLVENEVNGLMVDERNSQQMADALERLIHDEHLCERFGRRGRERVLEKFEIRHVTKQLADLFRASIATV